MAVPLQSALEAVTQRAGAVGNRNTGVAAHYGSPAGELAVCVQAVGLTDRSELTKLEVRGDERVLADLVQAVAGISVGPGGCAEHGGTWVCGRSRASAVVLAEPGERSFLEDWIDRHGPGFRVIDRTSDWAAIGLVGVATPTVLRVLGLVADPRAASPFAEVCVDGAPAELLLHSDVRALLLAEAEDACRIWATVEAAGKPFGISYVGSEALRRFTLRERLGFEL